MHKPFRFLNSCPRFTPWFIVIGLLLLLAPTAKADTIDQQTRAHLTRVWQGQFAAPQLLDAAPGRTPEFGLPPPSDASLDIVTHSPGAHLRSDRPHPAVARVIVPEGDATSYGSGTLIDARDQFGLVITNWHVVRDAQGPVEVLFPGGYRSKARALKVDADWDLAALVIWRPPIEPVRLSVAAPQPGDQLTICGYGQGMYRSATGRCTRYYAPRADFPQQMVELDVQARQGDSGGPIFNDRGELAGVLFGAGQGTTLGSFGGRVESFLATLAPDIGKAADDALVCCPPQVPDNQRACHDDVCSLAETTPAESEAPTSDKTDDGWTEPEPQLAGLWAAVGDRNDSSLRAPLQQPTDDQPLLLAYAPQGPSQRHDWLEETKTALAAIGLLTLGMVLLKMVC
jgi:hypothetical protein